MFTIKKDQIEAVMQVCKTAATRHANQAFECVLIEADADGVSLTGGDGVVEINRALVADVESGFKIAVNAQKFMQAVKACGDATVILKDQLTIKSGRRRFKLHTVDAEAYPAYPRANNDNKMNIAPQTLIETIKLVSFASAKNDVRHVLNGVFIGKHATATNGHRMAVADLGLKKDAIVSIEAVNKIPLDITGDVYLSDNVLSIVSGTYSFKCKLIDGKYVDYERVIPNEFTKEVTVDKSSFIDAIKAAQINAPESGNVVFHFCSESTIKSRSGKQEDAIIDFDCVTNSDFEMSFNSSYLLNALSVLDLDIVKMQFNDGQVRIDDDGLINIISMCRI